MATPSNNFASATARYVRGVRYATSRDVVISTTSVRASSASRSKVWTPPSADTVNVGPAAQTDVGIVKATSEKDNVAASPIIVVGISEASLERGVSILLPFCHLSISVQDCPLHCSVDQ